ncbi:MAG: DUF2599 domain-containing protein [Kocuria sp.]|nr:DUF2599 domain-containing protein [Kocuria sp.]
MPRHQNGKIVLKNLRPKAAVAVLAATALVSIPPASADPGASASKIADQIENVTLEPVAPLQPTPIGNSYVGDSTLTPVTVEVPSNPNQPISLADANSGNSISIGLPEEVASSSGELAPSGSVVFAASEDEGTDVSATIVEDGSVKIHTVLPDENAPTEYTYPMSLPDGASMQLAPDGGVLIKGSKGEYIASVATPWAKDAKGRALETHYSVQGDSIIQTISTDSRTEYPVVADPWLGINLIKRVVRTHDGTGNRYMVHPTAYGRVAPEIARFAAWNEAKSKGVPDRSTLKNQFFCHYDLRPAILFKGSWNLEAWRADKGYTRFILARCN